MSDDAPFPTSAPAQPSRPDDRVAREEITRFFDDRVAEATAALRKAEAELRDRESARALWHATGRAGAATSRLGEAAFVASPAMGRYQKAATPATGPRPSGSASGRRRCAGG